MPNPPPRKRFQIHLSTAVVMMFVAGGLIWANTLEHEVYSYPPFQNGLTVKKANYGWPANAAICGSIYNSWTKELPKYSFEYLMNGIFLNLILASMILFAVWFLCEYLISRRASQKGA